MSFASPLLLLGLVLLPLLVLGYRYLQRRPTRYAVRYTNLDVLAAVVDSTRSWRRHAGLALFLLALAALLVGFARPSVNRLADREEATIVLVIDVSGSMQAKDVEPTRLAAAQKVVRDFMKGLPERFQVGVVAFSETAEVAAPATADRQLAIDAIDYLYPQRGTAIGDGLARGVEVARAAEAGRTGHATSRRDPAALGRLADRRNAAPARGSGTSEVLQDPRLHDRSRDARGSRGVHPLRRLEDHSRAARTSRRCGRSPRRRAAASTRPRASATCATRTTRWGRS